LDEEPQVRNVQRERRILRTAVAALAATALGVPTALAAAAAPVPAGPAPVTAAPADDQAQAGPGKPKPDKPKPDKPKPPKPDKPKPPKPGHPGHPGDPEDPTEAEPFDALVFSRTAGFRHDSIPAGIEAITALGAEHDFTVTATEDPGVFTDEGLADYEVVVFLSTTGDVLDADQQAAFERYIQGGGGYAGIHAASD